MSRPERVIQRKTRESDIKKQILKQMILIQREHLLLVDLTIYTRHYHGSIQTTDVGELSDKNASQLKILSRFITSIN